TSSALGGTQDNGTVSYEGSLSWFESACGDGAYTLVDYNNPTNVYATCAAFARVRKSTTGARGTFSSSSTGINTSDPVQFVPPIAMDAGNPQILYFGTTKLYRSTNGAASWSAISQDLSSSSSGSTAISAIAASTGS